MPTRQLENKVALITGASKGIGRAIALGLAEHGAHCIVHFNRDSDAAAEVADQVRRHGRRTTTVQADISQLAHIDRMFETVAAEFGKLDILVNNAAVTGWSSLLETTEATWDEVIDTNLKGTFFCSLRAAAIMKDRGGGNIVNLSTNCVALGVKNLACYAASKGGIHALTTQLAVELAPYNIRVNTFAPGPTRVERNLKDDPQYDRTWGNVVPLARTAAPEEMIGPALFLASDQSSYMTGQIFYVDGGWTAQGKIPDDYWDQALARSEGAAT